MMKKLLALLVIGVVLVLIIPSAIVVSAAAKINSTTSTQLSASFIDLGSSVTDTAAVRGPGGSPIPTGSVVFQVSANGGSTWTTFGRTKTLSGGNAASDAYKPARTGSYFFRARYNGSTVYNSSQSNNTAEPLTVSLLQITSSSPLPNGQVGSLYSATLRATGGQPSYTWSISSGSLPVGLMLSPGGIISGTPKTAGGPSRITFKVTDSILGTASKAFSLAILGDGAVLGPDGMPSSTANSRMVLSIGNYTNISGVYPSQIAQSNTKMAWVWVKKPNNSPATGSTVHWNITSISGSANVPNLSIVGISNYSTVTRNIVLAGGFLKGTAGSCNNTIRTSGVSSTKLPTSYEKTVFSQSYPALDPGKYAVAAVVVKSTSTTPAIIKLAIEIDEAGLSPIICNTTIDFNALDPLQ
jgi:large repetitive protein